MPSAVPSKVGTATDQPTSPIMPKPSQTVCTALRCARSLRVSFAPTWRMNAVSPVSDFGLSATMEFREAAHESALQFCQHRTHLLLAFVEIHEFALDRLAQLAQAHATDGIAHRDLHIRSHLDQHALV